MGPVTRLWTGMQLARGRARVCFVTPTNVCNARCSFCEVWRIREAEPAPIEDLLRALDRLFDLGVRFVQFTGGEPLLYADLDRAVRHASDLGIVVNVITNGSLLRNGRTEALLGAGVDVLAVSIDHPDPVEHERSRGIPGLWRLIEQAVARCREARVPVLASTVITRFNHDALPEVVATVKEAGFNGIGFTYPTLHTSSTYPVGRNSRSLRLTAGELSAALQSILEMKRGRFPVFNTRSGIQDELRRVDGRPSRHPCRAGDRIFFLDHRLQLRRCMVLEETFGPVQEVEAAGLTGSPPCDRCSMMCFREPSILTGGMESVPTVLEHVGLAFRTRVLT